MFSAYPSTTENFDAPVRPTRIIAGPGLLAEETPEGTILRLAGSSVPRTEAPQASGYNSYFKLSLGTSGGAYVVTVADGATGGNNTAVVNGYTTYSIPPYSETVSADRLFYLKYAPAVISGGHVVSSASMAISSTENMTVPAASSGGAFYTQLGRVLFAGSGGQVKTVQDYRKGVAEVNWFVSCGTV